jgi:O-methyltransferase
MKLIYFSYTPDLSRDLLTELDRKYGLEHVEVIEGRGFVLPSTISHRYYPVWTMHFGEYDVDWSQFEPLDTKLLRDMEHCEVQALKMLDRHGRLSMLYRRIDNNEGHDLLSFSDTSRQLSYAERKQIYLRHVRYWAHVIKTMKPDAYISMNLPHIVYDFVIQSLCEVFGIQTIFYETTGILPKLLPQSSLANYSPDLPGRVREYVDRADRYGTVPDVDDAVQRFIDRQKQAAPHPSYMTKAILRRANNMFDVSPYIRLKMVVKDALNVVSRQNTLKSTLMKYYFELLIARRDHHLWRRYEKLAQRPNLDVPYVYFPLHWQPEASTSPIGDIFVEQILIAQMIDFCLPKGWKLYVKEHPAQASLGRTPADYREYAMLANTVLIDQSFTTFQLTNGARAVATVSGTVGWEALMRHVPLLVFGEVAYAAAPGAFRIRTIADCQAAMDALKNRSYRLDDITNQCFLRALQDLAIDAHIDGPVTDKVTADLGITHAGNVETFLHSLAQQLALAPRVATLEDPIYASGSQTLPRLEESEMSRAPERARTVTPATSIRESASKPLPTLEESEDDLPMQPKKDQIRVGLARTCYNNLPSSLKRILQNIYHRFPGTVYAEHNRWVRNVYVRAMHEQRRKIFLDIAQFCHINRPLGGYYFEFGCHGANTMRTAYDMFHHLLDIRYVGFDSFEGLPDIGEIDRQEIWEKGKLKTGEEDFRRICVEHGIPEEQLITIRGFYDDSLTDKLASRLLPRLAAVIYIDSDLYESAVPVLRFVRQFLQRGTIIVFDDWNCFGADPDRGERRAFREFCEANPELRFEEFISTNMQKGFVLVDDGAAKAA